MSDRDKDDEALFMARLGKTLGGKWNLDRLIGDPIE